MSRTEEPLQGRRVLIVEDRYLIAAEMADHVRGLGGEVVGPLPDVRSAQTALAREAVDLALLDINLDNGDVYPLADQLADAGVPFVFLTGYDAEVMPTRWRERPRLTKPVNASELRSKLAKLGQNDGADLRA